MQIDKRIVMVYNIKYITAMTKFDLDPAPFHHTTASVGDISVMSGLLCDARGIPHKAEADQVNDLVRYRAFVQGSTPRPLGFTAFRNLNAQSDPNPVVAMTHVTVFSESKHAHIDSLAVLPENRAQGVGKLILGHTLSVLTRDYGTKEVTLQVDPDNKNALRLYQKQGFEVIDPGDGDDETLSRYLMMARAL